MEHCCSITSLQMGETMHNIAKDMDTYSYTLPIGVCAGVAPFNFPAMIPLWMFPVGVSMFKQMAVQLIKFPSLLSDHLRKHVPAEAQ